MTASANGSDARMPPGGPPRSAPSSRGEVRGADRAVPRTGTPAPVGPVAEGSKTLAKGIQLLDLLARPGQPRGLTVTELAGLLGVGRPVVYRLVTTLQDSRLVVRRADGRVRLALGVTRYAAAVTPVVREEALPVLLELADAVGATAHLTVAEDPEAVALVVVEPTWTDVHVAYRTGARHPLTQAAAGRAILGGREGRTGPVASDGELQSGAYGIAVPVLVTGEDPTGVPVRVDASVGVITLGPLAVPVVEPHLLRAAAHLAAVLA